MRVKKLVSSVWFWLAVITLLGGVLRFYKINWGENHFFHPDEYHIGGAVERISFPLQMNPGLFSYGSFTVYLIYFTRLVFETVISDQVFLHPILIGRFYSALFSTLTVVVVFFIAKELFSRRVYWSLSALLVALMPGSIQQAHFTTPESILTFWLFLTLWLWIKWTGEKKLLWIYLSAISLGIALGTKIVAIATLILSPLLFLMHLRPVSVKKLLVRFALLISFLAVVVLVFLLVYPYSVLDWEHFRSSMDYETGVGKGDPVVFYTRQFIDTTPVIFQFLRILPFTLGPAILILGTIGLFFILKDVIFGIFRNKEQKRLALLLFLLFFLAYFGPNALLFAKWTRFIAPAFPFWSIFTVYFLFYLESLAKRSSYLGFLMQVSELLVILTSFVWSLMFFSIYLKPDVRISATSWANANLAGDSYILTEAGNMLEVPLEGNFTKKAIDFYHLDEERDLQVELVSLLGRSDYFIVQSRRMFMNHQRLPGKFPRISRYYKLLFSGELGFEKIKEFSSFPQFKIFGLKFEIDDEKAEETWTVFDHPVVRIYKKTQPMSETDYERLLEI